MSTGEHHPNERGREPRRQSPAGPSAAEPARSDAGQSPDVAPEHPVGDPGTLPADHPSRGTIDEGGDHTR